MPLWLVSLSLVGVVWRVACVVQALKKVNNSHKQLHARISKFGKVIDKALPEAQGHWLQPDEGNAAAQRLQLLNNALVHHLCRAGHVDIAERFAQVAGVEPSVSEEARGQCTSVAELST